MEKKWKFIYYGWNIVKILLIGMKGIDSITNCINKCFYWLYILMGIHLSKQIMFGILSGMLHNSMDPRIKYLQDI